MLLGAIISSTDGAAIFALLRGSTLRRKLARTLEGEAGFNDPVAVLLVIGFIDWIQQPDYGLLDMAAPFGREMGIGPPSASRSAGWRCRRFRHAAARHVRASTRSPLSRRRRSPSAAPTSLHGSGFLAVYLAGLVLGSARIPAQAHGRRPSTRVWRGSRRSRCSSRSACWCSRTSSTTSRLEGTALALVLVFVARPLAALAPTAFERFTWGRAPPARLGRACAARCRSCSRRSP